MQTGPTDSAELAGLAAGFHVPVDRPALAGPRAQPHDLPVPYMHRTRTYYAALGYPRPYRWAQYVDVPFTPLTKPLADSPIFPPMVVRMIQVGEKSGALETLLEKISEFYDEQVDATVEALTSLIEPLMIGIMGGIVGGIVLAVFLPIFKMQQAIGKNK